VLVGSVSSSTSWAGSDNHSNSYATITGGLNQTYATSFHLVMTYAKVATDVSIGSTVTLSWATGSKAAVTAICVTGLASSSPLDKTGGGYDSGGGGSTAVTGLSTGTLSATNEIVIAGWAEGGTYGTWTEDANFTSDNFPTPASNNNVRVAHCVTNCTATTSVPYGPSWVNSHINGAQVWSFLPAGGSVTVCSFALLGVGKC
jgi:hypothetical protein